MGEIVPLQSGAGIAAGASVARVELVVADLDLVVGFYTSVIGLWPISREGRTVTLGAGEQGFLVLREEQHAPPAPAAPGLFHTAFLVPSRRELSRALRRMLLLRIPLSGFSDHLVSEAIYLDDPEGNGIEVYRDRTREEWPRDEQGRVLMATDPLDIEGVLGETADEPQPPEQVHEQTRIGHVHLRVSDVAAAEAFYRDVVGFDVMTRYGLQASFLAAGGYHHILGINSWQSRGAAPPPQGARGLDHWELGAAGRRLDVRDPSGNRVLVS